jgi:hypothetical protein
VLAEKGAVGGSAYAPEVINKFYWVKTHPEKG